MDNVPVRIDTPTSVGRNPGLASNGAGPHKKQNKSTLKRIVLAAVLALTVAVVVLAGLLMYRSSVGVQIDSNKYQAVFFTNGQVYFGKLQQLNGGYFKLTNIFYLQAAAADSKNPQATSPQSASDVQLIKLGSEVHGPDDEMIISKEQVLFFENLKKDGKVTDSITKYASQKK